MHHTSAPSPSTLKPRLYRQPDEEDAGTQSTKLMRHRKRPQWGAAICAWSRLDRHGYQFEDGELRTFKSDFLHLLEPVDDLPAMERMRLLRALRAASGLNAAKAKLERGDDVQLTFDQQIRILEHLHEDGFQGESWASHHRGEGAKRGLKRHRDRAIAAAAELWDETKLDELWQANRSEEIVGHFVDVMAKTDLTSRKWLDSLRAASWSDQRLIAHALRDLLYGDASLRHRLEMFAGALTRATGKAPWQASTAPLALRYPAQHICVKPNIFREQAKTAGDGGKLPARVDGAMYLRQLEMVQRVSDRLHAADLAPRDLFDVYDFMQATLRPSARKVLEELCAGPVSGVRPNSQASEDSDNESQAA